MYHDIVESAYGSPQSIACFHSALNRCFYPWSVQSCLVPQLDYKMISKLSHDFVNILFSSIIMILIMIIALISIIMLKIIEGNYD